MRRFLTLACLVVSMLGLQRMAFADAIPGVMFVDGSILVNGSASSPAGNSSVTAPGTVTATTITGGGSTGSGLVTGVISLDGAIIEGGSETFINLNGQAEASQPEGYDGFATVNVSFATPRFSQDPLIFTVPQTAFYKVWDTGDQSVSLSAVSGTIGATTLSPGTYRITFSFGVTISGAQTFVEKTLDWTLRLSTAPLTNLPSDLDTNGVVDAADLAMLLAAWGTPNADINGNGTSGADDLAVLLGSWG